MAPLVSVIIPVYNGDRFVAEAIDSVVHQTYKNYEIIVVDDGSTDQTHQVLQPYFDRIRYFYQNNQGVAVARNQGIEAAQGELIAFLDQDDWFLPDHLALQVQCFEEKPELGLVSSGWATVDCNGNRLAHVEPWQGLPQLNVEAWVVWKPVFPGALMVRRSWLTQAGGFNSQFQQTSDVDLILRLALMGCPSDWVKQATVCYRQHDANTSRNVIQQVEELEAVLNCFFGRSDLPDEVRKLEGRSRYQSLVWSAWRLYQNENMKGMAACLKKSLNWKDQTRTEVILDWVRTFQRHQIEHGETLNTSDLIQSQDWQTLLKSTMSQVIV